MVLDRHYGDANRLPATGTLTLSGGKRVQYVGQGVSPDYFVVIGDRDTVVTPNSFGIIFTSLTTAQRLLGRPGQANDLVVTLRPGRGRTVVQREVTAALARAFPDMGFTVTTKEQNVGRQQLYNDIQGDREVFTIFALLVLLGAVFGAFNLVTRIIEAQRREIGIGMSLGAPARTIAARPLLVASEIRAARRGHGGRRRLADQPGVPDADAIVDTPPDMADELRRRDLPARRRARFFLPLLATIYPIIRAVRVTPIEAIRTGYLAGQAHGTGFRDAARPSTGAGSEHRQAAVPQRRAVPAAGARLTVLGIGATIAVLVALARSRRRHATGRLTTPSGGRGLDTGQRHGCARLLLPGHVAHPRRDRHDTRSQQFTRCS